MVGCPPCPHHDWGLNLGHLAQWPPAANHPATAAPYSEILLYSAEMSYCFSQLSEVIEERKSNCKICSMRPICYQYNSISIPICYRYDSISIPICFQGYVNTNTSVVPIQYRHQHNTNTSSIPIHYLGIQSLLYVATAGVRTWHVDVA